MENSVYIGIDMIDIYAYDEGTTTTITATTKITTNIRVFFCTSI
jgi:hypothetical protein